MRSLPCRLLRVHTMKVTTADTIPGVEIEEHLLVVHSDALMPTDGFMGQIRFSLNWTSFRVGTVLD